MPRKSRTSAAFNVKRASERWIRADDKVRKDLPPGVKLTRTLRGHTDWIGRIAWSPDGRMLASPSSDKTIRLWDFDTGECLRTLRVRAERPPSVAFDPTGQSLAIGLDGRTVLRSIQDGKQIRVLNKHPDRSVASVAFDPDCRKVLCGYSDPIPKDSTEAGDMIGLWDLTDGQLLRYFDGNKGWSRAIFNPTGSIIASGGGESEVRLWDVTNGQLLRTFVGHEKIVNSIDFGMAGRILASSSHDRTIRLWDVASGRLLNILEGHTDYVNCLTFMFDGLLLASKSGDDTIRLWNTNTGVCVAEIAEGAIRQCWGPGIAFHPRQPVLATVGSDPNTPEEQRDRVIHFYKLDLSVLLGQKSAPTAHYVNAKVVLVGDTGVGKSGLSFVLNNHPFKATDSTPGRRVWTFDSREVPIEGDVLQTRETLLWDLAGQPGYRVIHQLHLNEVAVALVVFDARSETDPLAGVRHWERALRLAQQRQGPQSVPMKKFLVSARNDRGGVSIGEERLQAILKDFGFDSYFKTSAKEGWNIRELRTAIEQAIPWEKLPEVSSSQLFADIKSFLLKVKETGQLLAPAGQLYDEFVRQHPDTAKRVPNLKNQFDTCIGRLENRDLIRRLTFGGYVLLQPELLDAYASAMVNTAKEEPDGLGSLSEEIALIGKFFVPEEQKVKDSGQEQLLLHATVEELVRHDLALREIADDGRHLVFPSQFNRDYEDAPEPRGKAVAITFDGPVQSLYSTLAVRLGHSGLFTTGRAEMWRNAAVFSAKAGGKCGLFLHEFAEGRGRLVLFFDNHASEETRFHFEEFVLAHAHRRALEGTVEVVRFFICSNGHPVPDDYVRLLHAQQKNVFDCPCGARVSLAPPAERLRFRSKVDAMDQSADRQRDFEAFVMSAKGETSTKSFHEWAGGERVTLAIVFTDVVGSTAMGEEIRDAAMNNIRRLHFDQSRKLISEFKGREIKTIGDSFMTAFKSVDAALDYAMALDRKTGHPKVKIRAGIHIGLMHVEESDVFGGTVNFAARVIGAIPGSEIWMSDRAKEDINRLGAHKHEQLKWKRHDNVAMKGFSGLFTLWSLTK